MTREEHLAELLKGIHPEVLAASADDLIARGWGGYPRRRIPNDWATRRPSLMKDGSPEPKGRVPPSKTPEYYREYRAANRAKINAARKKNRVSVIPSAIERVRQYDRKRLAKKFDRQNFPSV